MRTKIILILCFFYFVIAKGQKFEETAEFYMNEPNLELDSIYYLASPDKRPIVSSYLVKSSDSLTKFKEFPISELFTYSGADIFQLQNVELKNVTRIIRIDFEYSACCSDIESIYFIEDEQMNWFELPSLLNTLCDGPEPILEYRFPNQKFGAKNKILMTKSFLNDNYEVNSIKLQKTYNWNGKKIELEK